MTSTVFTASIVLGAAALAPACSSNPLLVGRETEGGGTSACASAGGTCVLPTSLACATEAPGSAQDCSTAASAGGGGGLRCCLAGRDAGPGRDAEPAEGGSGHADAGNDDAGGLSACTSAGGACVGGNVACARTAPASAQDCTGAPNPPGSTCCLALADAGPPRDAGAVDGGPDNRDSGSNDGGVAPACAAAGGTCINSTVACGSGAPASAQDCPFNPAGAYCCITPL
jgi:hypothetical protein